MANYTKQELRKREMSRWLAEGLPPVRALPACHCGAPAAIEVNRWPRVEFFCLEHLGAAEGAFRDQPHGRS